VQEFFSQRALELCPSPAYDKLKKRNIAYIEQILLALMLHTPYPRTTGRGGVTKFLTGAPDYLIQAVPDE